MGAPLIWLASYPRSGNTLLRTIMFHCFGLRSASVYPLDYQRQPEAGEIVGHIEHENGQIEFGTERLRLLKTHHPPQDDRKAIYIVRDGRDAITSLFHFYQQTTSFERLVKGETKFGSWTKHIRKWHPRNDTIVIRYEDMLANLRDVIERIAEHVDAVPVAYSIPPVEELSRIGGKYIRVPGTQRQTLDGPELELFWEIHGETMAEFGYSRES